MIDWLFGSNKWSGSLRYDLVYSAFIYISSKFPTVFPLGMPMYFQKHVIDVKSVGNISQCREMPLEHIIEKITPYVARKILLQRFWKEGMG